MRLTPIQTNFSSGELSPLTRGRVDVTRYHDGCKLMQNAIVLPQGGAMRRSGTRFVNEVKDSTMFTRLIPFEFSDLQAYVLEFGQHYIRFYRQGAQISVAGVPVEVVTVYNSADLPTIKFTQSADTIYLVHNNYPPYKLTRSSDTNWTLTQINFLNGPYQTVNKIPANTLTPSATSGAITVLAVNPTFAVTDVGRLVRVVNGADDGYFIITGFTDSTHIAATVPTVPTNPLPTIPAGGYTIWNLGSWSVTTGYPGEVSFFEQRLVLAASIQEPQTIWFSQVNDLENFAANEPDLTVIDSDAITYTIASTKVNKIQWLEPSSVLIIGTVGAEWIGQEANTTAALSPTNIQIVFQSNDGSNSVETQRIGSSIIFVSRSGKKVKELIFDFATDTFGSKDISIFSEHLLRIGGGIVDSAYQQEPFNILWFLRADGVLLGCTFLKEEQVIGWHQHIIGGSFNGGNSVVESICTIPKEDTSADQLYMIVKRTINGVQRRYIEFLEDFFVAQNPNDTAGMYFLDSCLTYTGVPATNFKIAQLPNTPISVIANGAVPDNQPINPIVTDGSGNFTLVGPDQFTNVTAGLPYATIIQTLMPSFQYLTISNQGKVNRIDQSVLRLVNTLSLQIGPDLQHLDELNYRQFNNFMDNPPPLFTGDFDYKTDFSPSLDQSYFIQQLQPYPMCILALVSSLQYYDIGGK